MLRIFDIKNAPLRQNGQSAEDAAVEASVRGIIASVRKEGDAALEKYAGEFDGQKKGYAIRIGRDEIRAAYAKVPSAAIAAMEFAIKNQLIACKKFKPKDAAVKTDGGIVRQVFTPIPRIGIYAPGGRAAYPSSVIMAAIPAKIAGVQYVCLCSPPPVNPAILVAADLCGIRDVFAIGGAQAIAAMAYGTQSVPKMDKIVGPGNKYVLAAKNLVRGISCDIDMPAGPSELLLVADGSANAAWAAADLLAQLEHDPDAIAVLIADRKTLAAIDAEMDTQMENEPRKEIIKKAMENSYAIVVDTDDADAVADFINEFAPEHLQLMMEEPELLLAKVKNAGSIFIGNGCSAVLGDCCIGSSHVLPTGGSARFASALSVLSFMKASTVVEAREERKLLQMNAEFAKAEGLFAHERAARMRLKGGSEKADEAGSRKIAGSKAGGKR
jgi:histidinol dehydrogenase